MNIWLIWCALILKGQAAHCGTVLAFFPIFHGEHLAHITPDLFSDTGLLTSTDVGEHLFFKVEMKSFTCTGTGGGGD